MRNRLRLLKKAQKAKKGVGKLNLSSDDETSSSDESDTDLVSRKMLYFSMHAPIRYYVDKDGDEVGPAPEGQKKVDAGYCRRLRESFVELFSKERKLYQEVLDPRRAQIRIMSVRKFRGYGAAAPSVVSGATASARGEDAAGVVDKDVVMTDAASSSKPKGDDAVHHVSLPKEKDGFGSSSPDDDDDDEVDRPDGARKQRKTNGGGRKTAATAAKSSDDDSSEKSSEDVDDESPTHTPGWDHDPSATYNYPLCPRQLLILVGDGTTKDVDTPQPQLKLFGNEIYFPGDAVPALDGGASAGAKEEPTKPTGVGEEKPSKPKSLLKKPTFVQLATKYSGGIFYPDSMVECCHGSVTLVRNGFKFSLTMIQKAAILLEAGHGPLVQAAKWVLEAKVHFGRGAVLYYYRTVLVFAMATNLPSATNASPSPARASVRSLVSCWIDSKLNVLEHDLLRQETVGTLCWHSFTLLR